MGRSTPPETGDLSDDDVYAETISLEDEDEEARVTAMRPVSPGAHGPSLPPSAGATDEFTARYVYRRRLGLGGMGEVRLYRDTRVGRDVALKVLRQAYAGRSELRRRFVREARVQGQLEHPAIVPVYDLGRTADGRAFFTMKRVRGRTLDAILAAPDAGPDAEGYSRRRLLAAFSNVCLAVDFAHARGVVHRDLKPGNIMFGDFGEVYVLDWGLAKLHAEAEREPTPSDEGASSAPAVPEALLDGEVHTAHGVVMGTPGYMAPEQVEGTSRLDQAVDVYALGVILFEILAGQQLHVGATAETLFRSTLDGQDARPSLRAPDRDVPPELDSICTRATARDPAARYPSARALHAALEGYLDGDRDLELRRALSQSHARDAALAAAADLSSASGAAVGPERRRALQAVGRALALDPANGDAMKTLIKLLTTPPRTLPDDVRSELCASVNRAGQVASRVAAVGYFSMLGMLPLLVWMGVRDWLVVGAGAAVIAVGGFTALATSVARGRPRALLAALLVISALILALTGFMFGSLVLTPLMALTLGVAMVAHPQRFPRLAVIVMSCAGVLVPLGLELAGVLPPAYEVRGGSLCVLPQAVMFGHSVAPIVCLAAAAVLSVVAMCLYVSKIRDALASAERMLHVQAWQLRQLVPVGAEPASRPVAEARA